MAKSPINLLQEYAIAKFKKYPEYTITNLSTLNVPQFSCVCILDDVQSSCEVGTSKNLAKHRAAIDMITKLGIVNIPLGTTAAAAHPTLQSQLVTSTSAETSNANYIGYLNEYCAKNTFTYPIYTVLLSEEDGFITECVLQNFRTTGKGTQKKISKRESARAMVELLKKENDDLNNNLLITTNQLISLDAHCENDTKLNKNITCVGAMVTSSASPCLAKIPMNAYVVHPPAHNYVGQLNIYCDKYEYRKPEYFDIGKDCTLFRTKCQYQSFYTIGKGLTAKFAKQDSAKRMIEMIGLNNVLSKTSQSNPEIHFISDQEAAAKYKELASALDTTVSAKPAAENVMDLIMFDVPSKSTSELDLNELHTNLHQNLKDLNVSYDITIMQKSGPCIMSFTGFIKNVDNSNKSLMECGESPNLTLGKLLLRAIEIFNR